MENLSITKVVNDFINQLSVFTYLQNETNNVYNKLKMYIEKTETEDLLKTLISDNFEPNTDIFVKKSKVTMFNGILNLNVFRNESKKTKKCLLQHIHLLSLFSGTISTVGTGNILQSLTLPTPAPPTQDSPSTLPSNLLGSLPNGLGTIVQNVSKLINENKVDPSQLLQDIMTGKNSETISNLLESVKKEVDTEIEKGTINEETLTNYTTNFLSNVKLS